MEHVVVVSGRWRRGALVYVVVVWPDPSHVLVGLPAHAVAWQAYSKDSQGGPHANRYGSQMETHLIVSGLDQYRLVMGAGSWIR